MKKTTVKRIITTILAVATVGSTAALFAGCGAKSPEEKAKDALNDFASEAMNDLNALSSKTKSKKEREEVDLTDFRKAATENYTIAFFADDQVIIPNPRFYPIFSSPLEVNGYTYTQKGDYKMEGMSQSESTWEISKDGVKCAECIIEAKWSGLEDPSTFTLYAYQVPHSVTDESDASFTYTETTNFDLNVPAALTADECKQHLNELETLLKNNTDTSQYKDKKNFKLDGIYYFNDTKGKECIRALYSYDHVLSGSVYVVTDGTYPFFDGSEIKAFEWKHEELYGGKDSMSNWIKLK